MTSNDLFYKKLIKKSNEKSKTYDYKIVNVETIDLTMNLYIYSSLLRTIAYSDLFHEVYDMKLLLLSNGSLFSVGHTYTHGHKIRWMRETGLLPLCFSVIFAI